MTVYCEKCTKVYGQGDAEIQAVHLVSVAFQKGINIITGKSGSGKSTLLYMLSGLEPPTSGEVFFQKNNLYDGITDIAKIRRQHFGFIFQNHNLIPELSVRDNILLPFYLNNISKPLHDFEFYDKRYKNIVYQLGIEQFESKHPSQISGGESQRVAVARAVIHSPDVIFADEPTGNLDGENCQRVINLLAKLTTDVGSTLILVTHDLDLISYADKLFTMKDGSLESSNI